MSKEILRYMLSIVPSITTRIGLLAFAVVVAAIVYILRIREQRKTISTLSPDERPIIVDEALSRYNITFGGSLNDELKAKLVLQEMKHRATRNLAFLFAIAFVFLVCFAMISFSSVQPPSGQPKVTDSRVLGYKRDILALRDDAEAKAQGWELSVRDTGIHLAKWMGQVPEMDLPPARVIIKHEYRGFALLMVANTFAAGSSSALDYAISASEEFDLALGKMQEISRNLKAGKQDLTAVFEWMTGPSEDLNRTHYLKAVALAVVARAGGKYTRAEAIKELNLVDREYRSKYPPGANPDLAWALQR